MAPHQVGAHDLDPRQHVLHLARRISAGRPLTGGFPSLASRFKEAEACYTKAIELDPKQGALYSNRSACYAELEKWPEVSAASVEHVLIS